MPKNAVYSGTMFLVFDVNDNRQHLAAQHYLIQKH